jgi:hypothetical protein
MVSAPKPSTDLDVQDVRVADLDLEVALVHGRCDGPRDRPVHEGELLDPVLDLRAQRDRLRGGGGVDDPEHDAVEAGLPARGGSRVDLVVLLVRDGEPGGGPLHRGLPLRVGGLPRGEQELLPLPGQDRGRGLPALGALGHRRLLPGQRRVVLGREAVQQGAVGHGRLHERGEQRLGVRELGQELLGGRLVLDLDDGEVRDGAVRRRGGLVRRLDVSGAVRALLVLAPSRAAACGQPGDHPAAGQQQGRGRQQHAAAGEGRGGTAGRASGRHGALSSG